jgi:hypothetical protein
MQGHLFRTALPLYVSHWRRPLQEGFQCLGVLLFLNINQRQRFQHSQIANLTLAGLLNKWDRFARIGKDNRSLCMQLALRNKASNAPAPAQPPSFGIPRPYNEGHLASLQYTISRSNEHSLILPTDYTL